MGQFRFPCVVDQHPGCFLSSRGASRDAVCLTAHQTDPRPRSEVVIFSQRALEHPVSRITKDAKSLISAAPVLNVSRDHETPGVSTQNFTASPRDEPIKGRLRFGHTRPLQDRLAERDGYPAARQQALNHCPPTTCRTSKTGAADGCGRHLSGQRHVRNWPSLGDRVVHDWGECRRFAIGVASGLTGIMDWR